MTARFFKLLTFLSDKSKLLLTMFLYNVNNSKLGTQKYFLNNLIDFFQLSSFFR